MPTSLGPAEILVILVIALIVLGPKRLPDAGRQVGRFISEVRHWSTAVQQEIRDVIDMDGEPAPPPPTAAPNVMPASAAPAVPSPADLGPAPPAQVPPPAPTPGPVVPVSPTSSAEWGLAPSAGPAPEPANAQEDSNAAADTPTVSLPAEWSTPPPHSEN